MALRATRNMRQLLPPLNFITLHYAYYFSVCLASAIIFWGASTPARSVSFIDALFLCISAMTQAGLNTRNLSEVNTFQQFMLFFLILIGSAVLISSVVVHTRKKAFEHRFHGVLEERHRAHRSIPRPFSSAASHRRASANGSDQIDGVTTEACAIGSWRSTRDGNRAVLSRWQARNGNVESSSENDAIEMDDGLQGPRLDSNLSKSESIIDTSSRIRFAQNSSFLARPKHRHVLSMDGVGARPGLENHPRSARTPTRPASAVSSPVEGRHYTTGVEVHLSPSNQHIDRNSQFHSLTSTEREHLGGVEYRAVSLLEKIILLYYVLWQVLGCLGLGAWVVHRRSDVTLQNALNPWWVGAFNAVSAFNNSGMSLLDANMVAFQDSIYMLITMGLLILAGNTCYPVFLRLILWTLFHVLPENEVFQDHRMTIRFLLDHPRRCYTNLFPSKETWWLLGSLVVLNGIDWLGFEVLNIGNESIATTSSSMHVLEGLFQALAVRSGGFYVVPIANLRIGLLVLYVLMMYISAYPVTITIRNSNVYEERSLGIYADDPSLKNPSQRPSTAQSILSFFRQGAGSGASLVNPSGRGYFVRQQLRGQLAHDLWWICVAVLLITIIETPSFERDPVTFSVFNIVFETVSAYGCVGISTGAPGVAFSFCGTWHTLSKLVLCGVMLRGRHRGLPVAIDRAVLLPGEHLAAAEEEDAAMRRERTVERKEEKTRVDRDAEMA